MTGGEGNHYIRFALSPATSDGLAIRKTLQDALLQAFGLTCANTYVDILWLAEDGGEVVVRVGSSEATRLMAAVTTHSATPRLSLLKDSSFLPALLSSESLP
ncbi:hypothetical protein PsYK624_050710 [Phanerochaete sordida]|uniref:Ribonucleases P/MRP subunit Pop8-like domain-containing protein n=1 Tax=Phanerochaete sordida TaxID=48140 RepID=A0A9P3G4G6_9APHY|nr:hypothetical protein PsYK624_050710 [Phanerochaete sordida]